MRSSSAAARGLQYPTTVRSVHYRRQLRVGSAFGFADRLSRGSPRGVRGILVNFDVRAVDTSNRAAGLRTEYSEHLRPKAAATPATKARVDRTPRAEFLREIALGKPRSQHKVNAAYHEPVVLRWSAAKTLSGDTSSASVIRSIFLAAPRADPAKPCDLMFS